MPTKIAWTDATWSPVVGCTKCSLGCLNCYAERMAYRLACMGQKKYQKVISTDGGVWNHKIYCDEATLEKPPHWKNPRRIFVCSMSDLFHKKVPFDFIHKVLRVIERCEQHTFQILTKRPEIAYDFFGGTSGMGLSAPSIPNLHLGVSISTQAEADEKIPILLQIPVAIRWVSVEPMLEEIDITNKGIKNGYSRPTAFDHNGMGIEWTDPGDNYVNLDWVVVGVESGPKRRPCKIEYVRSIVQQCKAAGVPVFVKQLSINGKVEHDIKKFPKDLQFQEYPK